ncbi:MAG: YebC/PmpR family DNA-binding transcriptional regulator [Patescibacteria group bacterium]|nr:YebC/PmpR family DNA-binding transcriptional regulator [Patescibacteria group bacterium]
MSGHSKWAQIKRQKGVADIKRGQTFTKFSNMITLAVKQGRGVGDPDQNFRLRLAIEKARAFNMPKENIERSIKRALGKQAEAVEEAVYEGFGPSGVAVIVEAVTDNRQRTTSDVKNIFDKMGGNLGQPGTVSYQFKQLGEIVVKKGKFSFDDIFSFAVDAGADDVRESDSSDSENDQILIYTDSQDLAKVRDFLSQKGVEIVQSELVRVPTTTIQISDKEILDKINVFIEKVEELDDVQKVYTNLEFKT